MPISPSYPGIYIEELPSSAHTIAAAPTSIAVFVGYTHPFKTKPANFGKAVEIFSFTDYEREFGGFSQSDVLDSNVAYAVNQFFLNGGSDAYVVGLEPQDYVDNTGAVLGAITAAQVTVDQIQFTALEPTDKIPIQVTIDNIQGAGSDIADLNIAYGTQTETFRKVNLDNTSPDFIQTRINGFSQLVTIAPNPAYPAAFTTPPLGPQSLAIVLPAGTVGTFEVGDFNPVFQQDSSLDKVSIFNLLILPGTTNNGVLSEALAFCERKQAFLIMDPPKIDVADQTADWVGNFLNGGDSASNIAPRSTNGAVYFPYIKSIDPSTGAAIELPPSGSVAGIYARTDTNRGVWKAPAGLETTVNNTTGVVETGRMTDLMQGKLNLKGVDCLRSFPGVGTVVFGARTLVSSNTAFQQWKYVSVRRMALFLEQTLYRNLGWVVFEPNDDPLWVAIRTSIENFMLSLFNQGAFQGAKPSQAFQVKCDSSTTTQQDIDNGVVNIIVAFAPLKPAEFVVIKIAQLAGQAQS
jgi:phage tail sheath protein FI